MNLDNQTKHGSQAIFVLSIDSEQAIHGMDTCLSGQFVHVDDIPYNEYFRGGGGGGGGRVNRVFRVEYQTTEYLPRND